VKKADISCIFLPFNTKERRSFENISLRWNVAFYVLRFFSAQAMKLPDDDGTRVRVCMRAPVCISITSNERYKRSIRPRVCRGDLAVRMSSSRSISIGDERKVENQSKGPTLPKTRTESDPLNIDVVRTDRRYLWKIRKNLRRLRTSELRAIVRVYRFAMRNVFPLCPVLSQRRLCGLSIWNYVPINSSSSSSLALPHN
jgi:hypothetical protein